MIRNKPPALARQLDRCDVCGDKTHRDSLVRTQVEFLELAANNYCIQSSYDASHWTTNDAAALGAISVGPNADWQRLSLGADNTLSELNGVQTFSTTKMIYTTVATTDLTSWSNMVFSAEVGPYHRSTTPDLSVVLGVYNIGTIGSLFPLKTWTINTQTRVWWTATPAEVLAAGAALTTVGFYIVATGGHWWADRMQLDKNATVPGQFVSTSGTAVDNSSDQILMTQRKVCNNCQELILSKSERFGKTDESPIDDPVETWAQEI